MIVLQRGIMAGRKGRDSSQFDSLERDINRVGKRDRLIIVAHEFGEISAHTELGKEARCHANRYIATAGGFSDRGDTDSHCPETIELYRCHLSHYHWHSRVAR